MSSKDKKNRQHDIGLTISQIKLLIIKSINQSTTFSVDKDDLKLWQKYFADTTDPEDFTYEHFAFKQYMDRHKKSGLEAKLIYAINQFNILSDDFEKRLESMLLSYRPNLIIIHFGYAYFNFYDEFIKGLIYLKRHLPNAKYLATRSITYEIPNEQILTWSEKILDTELLIFEDLDKIIGLNEEN